MKLEYYLTPVDFAAFALPRWGQKKFALGSLLEKNHDKLAPEKANIVLIGVEEDRNALCPGSALAPDRIREQLYQLNRIAPRFKIRDLGNLKIGKTPGDSYFALKDVCQYFLEEGVTVVVMGGSQDLTIGTAKAFEDQPYNLVTIDPRLDYHKGAKSIDSENYLTLLYDKQPNLFSHTLLGYQNYFTDAVELNQVADFNCDSKRLGQVRYAMSEIEPYMRGADLLSFDLNAVRQIEAPGQYFGSPNGFYAEEACQIAHYAGMADQMKIAGFYNLCPMLDKQELSAKLMAQIIWHFLEGFHFKVLEDPEKHPKEFSEYIIEMDEIDLPLTFYQSRKTGRWWMKIYNQNDDTDHIVPCSQEDYEQAARYEIPDRWWRNIRKLNQLAK
ncbi:arginase family protein [Mangrovibacterium marinum]|uniref:Arginase family enzyme n=1 Tax=Mangrovibacterium marinum TaxID=1639118 RepID=A0A2T5C0X4_9BACT|nr:arginase family protein [Mangrovibacterium marinum]PTN08283.1 arginase family enzyme [Mangrovibacterium marinum]